MVMAQSLFIALKQQTPDCLIDVLAPAWSLPLLARMPQVRQGIAMPLGHGQFGLSARFRLGRQLQGRYDQAIVLPNSWKSALVPFFAGIPLRIGYLGELRWGLLNDARRLDKKRLTMTVQRFVALGLAGEAKLPPDCPIPQLAIGTEQRQQAREKFRIDAEKKSWRCAPAPNTVRPNAGRPGILPPLPTPKSAKAGRSGCSVPIKTGRSPTPSLN